MEGSLYIGEEVACDNFEEYVGSNLYKSKRACGANLCVSNEDKCFVLNDGIDCVRFKLFTNAMSNVVLTPNQYLIARFICSI